MELKPNNIIKVSVTRDNFLYNWLLLLTPFHKLTSRQLVVLSAIIEEYLFISNELSELHKSRGEVVSVEKFERLVNSLLFSPETKSKICSRCGVSLAFFNVILSEARKKGVIIKNCLNKRYVPVLSSGDNYSVLFYFTRTD